MKKQQINGISYPLKSGYAPSSEYLKHYARFAPPQELKGDEISPREMTYDIRRLYNANIKAQRKRIKLKLVSVYGFYLKLPNDGIISMTLEKIKKMENNFKMPMREIVLEIRRYVQKEVLFAKMVDIRDPEKGMAYLSLDNIEKTFEMVQKETPVPTVLQFITSNYQIAK